MSSTDPCRQFSLDAIEQVKRATFVSDVEHHTVLPSTNSRGLKLAEVPHRRGPLLVLTDQQTAGRGRGVNQWWSAPGALTFSMLIDGPELRDTAGWPRVALTTGIAVCEALHQLCPRLDPALKWPNDVYVRSRKICGILVEVPPQSTRRIVIGVGVNVNNAMNAAPTAIRDSVTSLVDEAGYSFSLSDVLIAILSQLETHLDLLHDDSDLLQRRWEIYCMLTGSTVEVIAGSRTTVGVCQGINAQGALLIATDAGLQPCLSGIVTRWE